MRDFSSFFAHIGFSKYLDENERVILKLPIKKELLTVDGMVPTGLFSTMLDIVIGSEIGKALQQPTSTVNLNMNYFELSKKGPYTAYASIIHQDGKVIYGEGTIEDSEGKVAAKGTGIFKVLSPKSQ